ncbi:MAG TPA: hypothetical protein VN894_09630 [Polyangiaceae bacterium]|nr:hypothetical protein [Polyangiaceae bacterium]
MGLGFAFRQTMSGSYWRLDAPAQEDAMAFTFEAATTDVRDFVRDKTLHITGTIDAERLASAQDLDGTLAFRLLDERRVAYRFSFGGDDGRRYELSGQEEWRKISPIASLTLLPASIYDDRGEEIARATLRFDVRSDWAKWIRSFRLVWRS